MHQTKKSSGHAVVWHGWATAAIIGGVTVLWGINACAQRNLLKNPGFEETSASIDTPPGWTTRIGSVGKVTISDKEVHGGSHSIVIPANTAVEQRLEGAAPGAYLARCWIKSEAAQPVTLLLQDPDRPWSAYTCQETKVPAGKWVQLEVFCALNRQGTLDLTVGGMSKEFRLYHGTSGEMASSIAADDFELIRYEAKEPADIRRVAVWDAKKDLGSTPDWSAKNEWEAVEKPGRALLGTAVVQGGHLAGTVRQADGALAVYAIRPDGLKARCVIVPTPAVSASKCSMAESGGRTGINVVSGAGDHGYTAWFATNGVITIEANQVSSFKVQDCRLRFGLLPSFAGTDLVYRPERLSRNEFNIPSTQWLVGLVDGNDSMLVAVWQSDMQPVSLGVSGEGQNRIISSVAIGTDKGGFSLSFVEHPDIWHQESLNEDWLGEYTPIEWKRPFPARWMGQFYATSGGRLNFRRPSMDYSFPVASTKTRMWGVWFEDWNHYPFFFDGPRIIVHFEKTFVPNGVALFYFLEPAAADLCSPVEIVQQVLGTEKSAALFDFDANQLRKLKYSTPNEFMYDRPVCATTTRLSKIKKDEKSSVGINLATHLYEFIREIRGRVDQYERFFGQLENYLGNEQNAHPELRDYVSELESMIHEAQAKGKEIEATPLSEVQRKTDGIKKRLQEGDGDGFDCAELDVRNTAGDQDDLCRHYNRLVMRLMQTAAYKCGDSLEKATVAKHVREQSRLVLRQPTRWESRRTLYFFEP